MGTTALRAAAVAVVVGVCGAAATTPVITSVVDCYAHGLLLAPGSCALVRGTNLPTTASAGAKLNGSPAAVVYAEAEWLIEIPLDAQPGPATVTIGDSAPFPIPLQQYAPVLDIFDPLVMALHATGRPASRDNPAVAGETLTLYATGLGAAGPNLLVTAPVALTVGGVGAQVLSVRFQPGRGNYLVSIVVPTMLPTGDHQVALSVAGIPSTNSGLLPVVAAASPMGPVITAVQNGATFRPGLPSGAWTTVVGVRLATKSASWTVVDGKLPVELEGVRVTVGGIPAYVAYVSPTQINVVAPTIPAGAADVVVTNSLGVSAAFPATASTVGPAPFLWPLSYAVATHLDYSYAVKNGVFPLLPTKAAKPGEVIVLWGTGLGPANPPVPDGVATPSGLYAATLPMTVSLDLGNGGASFPAKVVGVALTPGLAAVWQIAIEVPAAVPTGDYFLQTTVSGVSWSFPARLTVER